jgi:hypothetical protein
MDMRIWWGILTSTRCNSRGDVVLPGGLDPRWIDRTRMLSWEHNRGQRVGAIVDITADSAYAYCAFRLFDKSIAGRLRAGEPFGLSPGYYALESRKPTAQDLALYGQNTEVVISKWLPYEISLCLSPACPAAWTLNAAHAIRGLPTESDLRAAVADELHLARATR